MQFFVDKALVSHKFFKKCAIIRKELTFSYRYLKIGWQGIEIIKLRNIVLYTQIDPKDKTKGKGSRSEAS